MSTFAGIFAIAFITGLSGAVMPGPLLAFTVNSAARRGSRVGVLVVIGHAMVESTLVVLIFAGAAAFLQNANVLRTIGGTGAAILVFMGIMMLRDARTISFSETLSKALADPAPVSRLQHPILAGVILTAVNPTFPVWWAGPGLTLVTTYGKTAENALVFYAGHISADLLWYAFIGLVVGHGRRFISDRVYRIFIALCALFLMALALRFGYSALAG